MSEKRIKLTTEDVFLHKGRKVKILTNGINTKARFDETSTLLFEHKKEKVVGFWEDVLPDLSARPNFDNDDFSQDIADKYRRGSIKNASLGIEIIEAYLDSDDVFVISESILLEASLVSIPANPNANTKIDFTSNNVMFFSNEGAELDINEYIKNKNNMEIKDKKKEKEVKPTELELLQLSLTEKDSKIDELSGTKVELNLSITNLNKDIETLTSEKEALNLSLTAKDSKMLELSNEVKQLKTEKIDILLDSAIEDGKISKEAKEDFLELSYDKAKSILEKINPSTLSLIDTLNASNSIDTEKTYKWYLANDLEGLKKLSKENPALYKQLESQIK